MKIIGTGTIHHLPKGSEHEVTEEIGHILVKSGRAVAKNEVLIGNELVELPAKEVEEGEKAKDEVKNKDEVKEDKKPKAKKK